MNLMNSLMGGSGLGLGQSAQNVPTPQTYAANLAQAASQAFNYNYQLYQQQGGGGPGQSGPMLNQLQAAANLQKAMYYKWMFNGKVMTIEEFAEKVYGDTPEATHFLLKHKGIE
jgi:hypothetical protein